MSLKNASHRFKEIRIRLLYRAIVCEIFENRTLFKFSRALFSFDNILINYNIIGNRICILVLHHLKHDL